MLGRYGAPCRLQSVGHASGGSANCRTRSRARSGCSGNLEEGAKLPNQRELAQQEGVAIATLGRALDQLQVEGYIATSRRGTFVANAPEVAPSSYDRITRVLRTGSVLAEGETLIVTAAELIKPPLYVPSCWAWTRAIRWCAGSGTPARARCAPACS
ncbi:GntR family transcriptional regulator [Streptomyces mirabilis]|uniref:GntR family transcriptional regulator n=1 Tax=Streptomyces mirabilis TaxID=68239 RepID=UPI003684E1F2